MTTSGMVLSGGESSRFGGSPKALLPTGDRSAIRRIVEQCLGTGLDPVVVVVGAHHGPIARELTGLEVQVVVAERWFEGRTASMQAGLAAIPPASDVLFWPVDHPFVDGRTVDRVLSVGRSDLIGVWFIPTYQGRGGHPVLWRSSVRTDLLDLRPDAPIRSLIPEFGPQVVRVPVGDPGVVENIDTPDRYREALEAWGRREMA